MIDLKGKHITIAGAARSGIAAARLLKRKGYEVFVSDNGPISKTAEAHLIEIGVPFEQNGHTNQALDADILVTSPGVPDSSTIIRHFSDEGRPVYSEIEAASWFSEGNIAAITGTNGKTTTTSWLDHLWETAGRKHVTAGNIGVAFSDVVEQSDEETDVILEVSSFQLDHIDTFRPHVAAILNITPDHMDRYDHKLENYVQSKFRIIENQTSKDFFIYDFDDPIIGDHLKNLTDDNPMPHLLAFSLVDEVPEGAFIRAGEIVVRLNNREESIMKTEEVSLRGQHNLRNGLAAILAARAFEIRNEAIRESLSHFEGVEHRLEFVRELDGIRYVNDSKATNVNAVWYALGSFDRPIVLILGGRDKGNDYSELYGLVEHKVRAIIAIGESADKVEEEFKGRVSEFVRAKTMDEAVKASSFLAKKGDVVLLSPACASFDMFDNYEHRGQVFKESVRNL